MTMHLDASGNEPLPYISIGNGKRRTRIVQIRTSLRLITKVKSRMPIVFLMLITVHAHHCTFVRNKYLNVNLFSRTV
jgi:hypothetical protein